MVSMPFARRLALPGAAAFLLLLLAGLAPVVFRTAPDEEKTEATPAGSSKRSEDEEDRVFDFEICSLHSSEMTQLSLQVDFEIKGTHRKDSETYHFSHIPARTVPLLVMCGAYGDGSDGGSSLHYGVSEADSEGVTFELTYHSTGKDRKSRMVSKRVKVPWHVPLKEEGDDLLLDMKWIEKKGEREPLYAVCSPIEAHLYLHADFEIKGVRKKESRTYYFTRSPSHPAQVLPNGCEDGFDANGPDGATNFGCGIQALNGAGLTFCLSYHADGRNGTSVDVERTVKVPWHVPVKEEDENLVLDLKWSERKDGLKAAEGEKR